MLALSFDAFLVANSCREEVATAGLTSATATLLASTVPVNNNTVELASACIRFYVSVLWYTLRNRPVFQFYVLNDSSPKS